MYFRNNVTKVSFLYIVNFTSIQSMTNPVVVTILVVSIILLFGIMVLSAMAASDTSDETCPNAYRYASLAAIISGFSVGLLVLVLIIYIYYEKGSGGKSKADDTKARAKKIAQGVAEEIQKQAVGTPPPPGRGNIKFKGD